MNLKKLLIVFGFCIVSSGFLVAANDSVQVAEKNVERCEKMRQIYKQTGGEYGWPNC